LYGTDNKTVDTLDGGLLGSGYNDWARYHLCDRNQQLKINLSLLNPPLNEVFYMDSAQSKQLEYRIVIQPGHTQEYAVTGINGAHSETATQNNWKYNYKWL